MINWYNVTIHTNFALTWHDSETMMLEDACVIWRERSDERLIGPTVGQSENIYTWNTALAIEWKVSFQLMFCVNINIIYSLLDKVGLTTGWSNSMRKIWPLFDLFNFMVNNACKIVSYLVVRCTQPMTVQHLNQIFIAINVVNL